MSLYRLAFPLLLFACLTGCTEDFFVDLEPLERDLLGVWVAAERQDTTSLSIFNDRAQLIWRRNGRKFAGMTLSREEQVAIRLTEVWMKGLDEAVEFRNFRQVDHQLAQLHATLRELRAPLVEAHPADQLYAFDDRWGWVEEISHDQLMCLVEWSEYEEAFQAAKTTWRHFRTLAPGHAENLFPGLAATAPEAEITAIAVDAELVLFEDILSLGNHTLTTETCGTVRQRFLDHVAVLIGYPEADITL
ncbi:hypothetical protein [Neolewinella xylanilytica]|nr:hypothetical protein [Neolewinella xylanilytica]